MTSSRHGLKILALLIALLVLGAVVITLWIRHVADRKWAAAQDRIQQLIAAHPPIDQPPPPTAASKEIQIHFVAAIREAVRRIGSDRDALTRQRETWNLVRSRQAGEAADNILIDAQEVLGRLRQGGRQCAATPSEFPPGWREDWDLTTLQFIMNCCVLHAQQLRRRKAPLQAAEAILDSLQLGRFWALSGKGRNRNDAMYHLDASLEEMRDILANEPLSRDQLSRLERELEPLDVAIRSPLEFLEAALARWSEGLDEWDLKELEGAPYRWRYFLPRSLMKAEAFEFWDHHFRRLLDDQPYLEMARDAQQLARQSEETKNPILGHGAPSIMELHWIPLERMSQIRLLRMAARYRATGEILQLKDPFGAEMHHSRTETRMKFWSLDNDGRDDRGDAGSSGRWDWRLHRPVPGAAAPRFARDVTIEVEHPRPE